MRACVIRASQSSRIVTERVKHSEVVMVTETRDCEIKFQIVYTSTWDVGTLSFAVREGHVRDRLALSNARSTVFRIVCDPRARCNGHSRRSHVR
jgi:hypothetical protein